MMDKYPSISPYAYCAWTRPTGGDEHRWIKYNIVNNPVKLVDPDGRDTINIKYNATDKKWVIDKPILAKGNDVFIINGKDGKDTRSKENFDFIDKDYPFLTLAYNVFDSIVFSNNPHTSNEIEVLSVHSKALINLLSKEYSLNKVLKVGSMN
ncbi:MAG: hypothetical protein MJZ81_08450 [Bacteroidales bacterium]|nr:hypothetical protein [Bacteroidales bacterium]